MLSLSQSETIHPVYSGALVVNITLAILLALELLQLTFKIDTNLAKNTNNLSWASFYSGQLYSDWFWEIYNWIKYK